MNPENSTPSTAAENGGSHLRYLLTAYLFENISPAGKAEVEAHLAACADCRAELEDLRATLKQVEQALDDPESGLKKYSFEARRLERILAATKKRPWYGRPFAMGIAAAVLVSFGLLLVSVRVQFSQRGRPVSLSRPNLQERDRGFVVISAGSDKRGLTNLSNVEFFDQSADRSAPTAAAPGAASNTKGAGGGEGTVGMLVREGAAAAEGKPPTQEAGQRPEDYVTGVARDERTLALQKELPEMAAEAPASVGGRTTGASDFGIRGEGKEIAQVLEDRRDASATRPAGPEGQSPPSTPARKSDSNLAIPGEDGIIKTADDRILQSGVESGAARARGERWGRGSLAREGGGVVEQEAAPASKALQEVAVETRSTEGGRQLGVSVGTGVGASGNFGLAPEGKKKQDVGRKLAETKPGEASDARRYDDRALGEYKDLSSTQLDTEALSREGVPPPEANKLAVKTAQAARSRQGNLGKVVEDFDATINNERDGAEMPLAESKVQSLGQLSAPMEKERTVAALKMLGGAGGGGGQRQVEDLEGRRPAEEIEQWVGGGESNDGASYPKKLSDLKKAGAVAAERAAPPAAIPEVAALEPPAVERFQRGDRNELGWHFTPKPGESALADQLDQLADLYTHGSTRDPRSAETQPSATSQGRIAAGDPGPAETQLRAYMYYQTLDQNLSLDRFNARPMPIPPPAVGDENLGEADFRKLYGVNPFVDSGIDHLSTFAMDVDTASFTRVRNLLAAGKLPEPRDVRVEEFVNYFHQDYPADLGAAFSAFSEGGPSPFGEGLDLLKVTVKARELRPGERKDAVLTFAIDTSGSMFLENRLELVKQALRTLLGALGPDDRVGIVAYSDQAYLVLPHTPARERRRLSGALDSLTPRGASNVEAGLELAYRLADDVLQPRALNRVILCSDGVATAGARGPDEILKKVKVFAARGIYLSTVGFGRKGYNDVLMERLADEGNGRYDYVASAEEAERIFRASLPATLQVLAQDAKIQVDWNPEVVSHYRLLGYENRDVKDEKFRDDTVDAGEVGPGTTVTALYELSRRANAHGPLGRIFIRYRDTGNGRVEELNFTLSPGVLATALGASSDRFRFIACAAEVAELLRSSYWARNGSYASIVETLRGLSPEFQATSEWQELTQVVLRAQELTLSTLQQLSTQQQLKK